MRNEIAEWMLAQATTPEQARAVLGDLLEAQPGPVDFWIAVARATVSIARHQPRQILLSFFWCFVALTDCFALPILIAYYVALPISFALHPRFAVLPVIGVTLAGAALIWILRRFIKEPSILTVALFWAWFFRHFCGWPLAVSMLILSPAMVLGWRLNLLRRRANAKPENDRLAAG